MLFYKPFSVYFDRVAKNLQSVSMPVCVPLFSVPHFEPRIRGRFIVVSAATWQIDMYTLVI